MITTTSLVTIKVTIFFSYDNIQDPLSQELSNMQYNIIDHSRHIVHYILMTYLLCNWKFAPLDPILPIFQPPTPLATANLFSGSMSCILFCYFRFNI